MTLASQQNETNFARYGRSFQESLCQLMIEDRAFADQLGEVLVYDFFEQKYLQAFAKMLYDYKTRYKIHPSRQIVSTLVRTNLNEHSEVVQSQVRDFYSRTMIKRVSDADYIKESAIKFCRLQKLKEAVISSAKYINNPVYSDDELNDKIIGMMNKALSLGLDNDFGHEFIDDFELRYNKKARSPITTGWELFDALMGGGLGKGELGVVIAPTGAGKSMTLVHLAAKALIEGKNVVYYTLELGEESIGQRFDSCISGIELDHLKARKVDVLERIKEIPGRLIIKQYPPKRATTHTLRNHLDRLQNRGQQIDMILVDYGDLLRTTTKYEQKHDALEAIYEDLRAIAIEYKIIVWTASQTNRGGLDAEVVTMASIADAYSKCFPADFIFSLSRTTEDKQNNAGRVFIAKSRLGPDGRIFPISMDTGRVYINVLEPKEDDDPTEGDSGKVSMKDQEEILREKYKKWRKSLNEE